jgi:hypothetical protein
LWNWLNIREVNWYRCLVTMVLKVMKLRINWRNWDLNVHSQDLNQLVAFQQELPRRLSGTGQTETIKNTGNP